MRQIFFDWGVSDRFGWGIYGLNLLVHGSKRDDLVIRSLLASAGGVSDNPLIQFFVAASSQKQRQLANKADIYLQGLGNEPVLRKYEALKSVGVIFFEDANLTADKLSALKSFDYIVAGSTWNKNVLSNKGVSTELVIQGVDPETFRPRTSKGIFKNRFVVFSGGKLEHRKGQDLVVAALSKFIKSYPDTLLVSAWSSPWQDSLMGSINFSNVCKPITKERSFEDSVKKWLSSNAINEKNFVLLPSIPNALMPEIYSEVDVALFPNRCEGGTNLVAMEALACGIPSIISSNTGHLDLIEMGITCNLEKQSNVDGREDWGESDLDEIYFMLEQARGLKQAEVSKVLHHQMIDFSWERSIKSLIGILTK